MSTHCQDQWTLVGIEPGHSGSPNRDVTVLVYVLYRTEVDQFQVYFIWYTCWNTTYDIRKLKLRIVWETLAEWAKTSWILFSTMKIDTSQDFTLKTWGLLKSNIASSLSFLDKNFHFLVQKTWKLILCSSLYPVILFLHGAGFSSLSWALLVKSLSASVPGCYLVAIDIRGHGDSRTSDESDFSFETLSEDVCRIYEALLQDGFIPGGGDEVAILRSRFSKASF